MICLFFYPFGSKRKTEQYYIEKPIEKIEAASMSNIETKPICLHQGTTENMKAQIFANIFNFTMSTYIINLINMINLFD
jgi:hypothetical protein